ncbi:F-box domain-containing protein [Mycena chlorophos]|uniref:F-box domain-containing protein n=1 Tax=Mycena chlorophos TaxID=658473 RepID=A0A8H6T6H8_MYCCL|nr:F-box domain-containing protein [Mycena chlorophos]
MALLPLDVYISILEAVPAERETLDSVLVLVNCLQANSILREAALRPSLWEPHYTARYQHHNWVSDTETELKARCNSNWRLMFAERRRQDRVALDLLDQMVATRDGRYDHAARLVSGPGMGFDIWDALEIECILSAPSIFGSTTVSTITRRYWAEGVLNMLLRTFAVTQWCKLPVQYDSVSFVDGFSYMSCFFGQRPQQTADTLAALNEKCRLHLSKRQLELDPEKPGYDLTGLCAEICRFMHEEEGFGPVDSIRFYDILNHFPHAYLATNKKTIPLSLVHVFVSLARHIGIPASPVEFPGRVLAHIASQPGADDFMMDVYGSAVVSLRHDLPGMLHRLGIPPDDLERYITPCGAAPMLLRAARNIFAALQTTNSPSQAAVYVTISIHLILSNEPQLVDHMFTLVPAVDPFYVTTFLAALKPHLRPANAYLLEKVCASAMKREQLEAATVHPRSGPVQVAHYVGMVFEHRVYGYTGTIIGWDVECAAGDDWQAAMDVSLLPRGANQPFYHVISLEGSQRYVAEDNILSPISLTAELVLLFLEQASIMSRYFSDAYISPAVRCGRWRLSPELRQQYPDDEAAAQMHDE